MFKTIICSVRRLRITAFHRLFPRLAIRRAVRRHKEREVELRLLGELCDPRKLSIDVGANVGVYTAALMPVSAHVVAIEPHPRLARVLSSLPTAKVTVRRAIASSMSGEKVALEVEVVDQIEADALGHVATGPERKGVRRYLTHTIALDEWAANATGFVKIDVEGHELDVLAGAEKLISAQRPVFLVEAEARHRDQAPGDIFAFFERRNYRGFFVRQLAIWPVAQFDLSLQNEVNLIDYQARETADYVNNFIFIPREAPADAITLACQNILRNAGALAGAATS